EVQRYALFRVAEPVRRAELRQNHLLDAAAAGGEQHLVVERVVAELDQRDRRGRYPPERSCGGGGACDGLEGGLLLLAAPLLGQSPRFFRGLPSPLIGGGRGKPGDGREGRPHLLGAHHWCGFGRRLLLLRLRDPVLVRVEVEEREP